MNKSKFLLYLLYYGKLKKEKMKNNWQEFGISNNQIIQMYKEMLLIRRFEERAAQEYGKGKIGGFCHLYIGQEAVAVGAGQTLREDDTVFTAYRDHGHALLRGITPNEAMAELFGKYTGCSKGMGGSMHFYNVEKGFFGGWGIVGAHPPLATGTAFATKYLGKDSVTICFLGEAAANQGVFHETLNLAQLWKIPIVFIIENNHYGMGTEISRAFSGKELRYKGEVYGMEIGSFDGMSVVESYKAVKIAVDRARKESLPTLLEAETYRYRGHSMSDPGTYRTKEEVENYKNIDPIESLKKEIIETKILSENELEKINDEIKILINQSVKFAEESPEPPIEALYQNVYL